MATADQLLARVLVRCMWPSTNAPLTDAEILEILDAEIRDTLWPQLLQSQGDWHLASADRALVAEQRLYRMPKRMWGPIKDVLLVDSAGEQTSLDAINIEELGRLRASGTAPGVNRFVWYIEGDSVGLFPAPAAGDTSMSLRIRYYRSPNTLCLAAEARQIVALPTSTTLTLASTIAWTSSTEIDFIGSGVSHQVLAEEQGVTSVVSTTLTMDAAYPSSIEADDWASVSGTTPVAPVPEHMISQLIHRASMVCLHAGGDQQGFARAATLAGDAERRALAPTSPRQEAEPNVILPRNSPFMRWRR